MNKKVQPTPGPFRIAPGSAWASFSIYGGHREHIAEVWSGRASSKEVAELNAVRIRISLTLFERLRLSRSHPLATPEMERAMIDEALKEFDFEMSGL